MKRKYYDLVTSSDLNQIESESINNNYYKSNGAKSKQGDWRRRLNVISNITRQQLILDFAREPYKMKKINSS